MVAGAEQWRDHSGDEEAAEVKATRGIEAMRGWCKEAGEAAQEGHDGHSDTAPRQEGAAVRACWRHYNRAAGYNSGSSNNDAMAGETVEEGHAHCKGCRGSRSNK